MPPRLASLLTRIAARPTRLGWGFIGVTGAFGIIALIARTNLITLIWAMMLSFLLCSGVLPALTLRRLSVRQILPGRVYAGKTAPYTVMIRNERRALPSYALSVAPANGVGSEARRFLLQLRAGESVRIDYSLHMKRRGWQRLPGVSLSTGFPFGLFTQRRLSLPDRPALVFPAVYPLNFSKLAASAIARENEIARRGPGAGFHTLRDYRDGDDPRLIHWKTSARIGALMLKEPEAEERRKLSLTVEDPVPGAPPGLVESNISLAASLAVHAARRGWEIQLVHAGGRTPLGSDEAHLDRILEQLALYEPPVKPRPLPFVHAAGALRIKLDDPDPLRGEFHGS